MAQKAFLWYLPDLDYVFQIDFRNKLEDIFIFLEFVYEVMKFIDRGFNIIRFDHTGKPAVRWFSFVFSIK
ncbi:MAG: hypothetical protein ABUK17_06570 [Syntrophobacteria bacterium]